MRINKFAAATAVAAAFSLLATPVAAVELPRSGKVQVYDGDAGNAERHRRWRRDRNDIDTGDVVAGVVLLGAIAAIAGAAKHRRDRERYEQPYPLPDEEYGYRAPRDYERSDSRGIDRAVDICVGEVERGAERVGSVNSALRDDEGWYVAGELEGGTAFSCRIGNDGRIGDVNLGSYGYGTAPAEAAPDGQWSDDDYAKARVEQGDRYAGDDGRYETAQAPDFAE